jgi:hypothetical protein
VVTYYDFRNDTSNGKESADYWAAYCTASDCTVAGNWREVRLTTASFDVLQAPLAEGGLFLGDYMGLTRSGSTFYPAFVVVDGSKRTSVMVRQIQF